jgi:hypothetical protein
MRLLPMALAAVIAGGLIPAPSESQVLPKGPLAHSTNFYPATLASCPLLASEYSRPFWRPPYRLCRSYGPHRLDEFVVDADTIVVQVHSEWAVPAGARRREFGHTTLRLGYLGSRVTCANDERHSWMVWKGADGTRVALRMSARTDEPGRLGAAEWLLILDARLGPLPDELWCPQARAELGA